MTNREKIDKLLSAKGITIYQLEKNARLGNGLVAKAIKSNGKLSVGLIEKILGAYPDVNRDFLLFGEGDVLNDAAREPRAGKVNRETDKASDADVSGEPTPMQLMKIIVETNESIRKDHSELISLHKQIVETNAKLADTNSELAKKIPEPIASERQQIPSDVEAKLNAALGLLFEIGSGKKFQSKQELQMFWNKKISAELGLIESTDTQTGSDKKSRVKT